MMKYIPCFCLQIKRLENRLSKTECTDNNGQERKDGERWKKDSCTLCECKVSFLAKSLCTLCWTHYIQYPDEPIVSTWRFCVDLTPLWQNLQSSDCSFHFLTFLLLFLTTSESYLDYCIFVRVQCKLLVVWSYWCRVALKSSSMM